MIKLTYIQRMELSKRICAVAKEKLAQDLNMLNGEEMSTFARVDAREMRAVANILRTKGQEAASKKAQSLDTAVRDTFPDSIWYPLNGLDSNEY